MEYYAGGGGGAEVAAEERQTAHDELLNKHTQTAHEPKESLPPDEYVSAPDRTSTEGRQRALYTQYRTAIRSYGNAPDERQDELYTPLRFMRSVPIEKACNFPVLEHIS